MTLKRRYPLAKPQITTNASGTITKNKNPHTRQPSAYQIFADTNQPPPQQVTITLPKQTTTLPKLSSSSGSFIVVSDAIQLDELVLTEKIGQGTYGKVYKGIYKGIEVAVKILKDSQAEQIKEFENEATILKYFFFLFFNNFV